MQAGLGITSPEFVKVWNLLDIVSILCDSEVCDVALTFWLIEELLDSQTISGCRVVFDFLESRRERLTAKHFMVNKNLVVLRTCNELLRRLSRAEDTTFCGRVFIFLFQSFPLGDRSSVNLRGEYHIENVTTYDAQSVETSERMDIDAPSLSTASKTRPSKTGNSKELLDTDSLYPIFWSLQDIFSQPKKLFNRAQLDHFKSSLETTVKAMKAHMTRKGNVQHRSADENKQVTKKRFGEMESGEDEISSTFNPKYLTNRDLFDLEVCSYPTSASWHIAEANISG